MIDLTKELAKMDGLVEQAKTEVRNAEHSMKILSLQRDAISTLVSSGWRGVFQAEPEERSRCLKIANAVADNAGDVDGDRMYRIGYREAAERIAKLIWEGVQ